MKTKIAKLMNAVTLMKICVNKIENVESQAIEAYNAIQRDGDYRATTNSEKKFLNRITVNFIRHELTGYDRSLEEIAPDTAASDCDFLTSRTPSCITIRCS